MLNLFGMFAMHIWKKHGVQSMEFSTFVLFADIENLTSRTGNFKRFDIFITMLRSGLLKVCIYFLFAIHN
jgi:hypothetical protein